MRKSQIFAVIETLKDKYPIAVTCKFYNVSRQGYYDWKARQSCPNPDADLIEMIKECQSKNKNRMGYRRVKKWLYNEKNVTVNHKKVLRITNRNNLMSKIRRRKIFKFKPNGNIRYENVLNGNFHSEIPNEKWVTDISYIIMSDGTLYLSAIRDLCGNFIVAYKYAIRQTYPLVRYTIEDALKAEKPENPPILHSDGGGQYRSYDHKDIIKENGLIPSMSRPARCGDNAMAENFFSTFKAESIYYEKPTTISEATKVTDEFIEYYNYERIQGNGLTPYQERQMAFERLKNEK